MGHTHISNLGLQKPSHDPLTLSYLNLNILGDDRRKRTERYGLFQLMLLSGRPVSCDRV